MSGCLLEHEQQGIAENGMLFVLVVSDKKKEYLLNQE